ncbi:transposable element Tcb2 transposase [Trichonephila clavipes]|nr:transposable element Tcb2 transposase [Trichonephila clavipes]
MASRYHLEESVKWRIIGRLEAGQSITETATCLNISRQTVSKLWKQFQNDGTVVRRPGQGRKRMTTASEDRYLALTARRNRKATARQLSSELAAATGAVASRQTIYRRLNEKGLYARKPRPANSPDLNPIENLWDYLGTAIARRHPPPRDVNGLKTALLEEWSLIPQTVINNVISSLKTRCDMCVRPDGRGYELVSSVRALVPQKFSVEEELMHVKHVEVKSPHVGVMWKFGRGVISSGIVLVT